MSAPFNLETDILNGVKNKDKDLVNSTFTKNTVVVFEGKRISGDKMAEALLSLDIKAFSVDQFEVALAENIVDGEKYEATDKTEAEYSVHQSFYNLSLVMKDSGSQSFAGTYSITSTWKSSLKEDTLVLVMIQKSNG